MSVKLYIILTLFLLTGNLAKGADDLISKNNEFESLILNSSLPIESIINKVKNLQPSILKHLSVEPKQSIHYKKTFYLFGELGNLLSDSGKFEVLPQLIKPVLEVQGMAPVLPPNMGLDKLLFDIAFTYLIQSDYDSAEYYFRLAIPLYKKLENENLYYVYLNLGNVYYLKKEYEKSIVYYELCRDLMEDIAPNEITSIYNNIAAAYLEIGKLDQAFENIEKCKNSTKDPEILHHAYTNLGRYYQLIGSNGQHKKEHQKALDEHLRALTIRRKINDSIGIFNSYLNLGANHFFLGEYQKAIQYYNISSSYDSKKQPLNLRILLKENTAEAFHGKRNFGRAIKILASTINEINSGYYGNIDAKDKLIFEERLNKKIEIFKVGQMEHQQFLLIFCFLIICSILAFLYQHEQSKKEKIQKEKLEIIDEHTVELANKGTETREEMLNNIGQELHDEIQNFIYAMKLGLDEESDAETIQNLNELNTKVRNISHGMKLGEMDFGLTIALRELCSKFNLKNSCKVELLTTKVERRRFNHKVEQNIYRIVQEALTNTVKHAKAKNVYIQLLHFEKETESLRLSIEDDGNGFDMHKLKPSIGLKGMQERAEGLGGTFQIDSQSGSGTIIMVEIPAEVKGIEGKGREKS